MQAFSPSIEENAVSTITGGCQCGRVRYEFDGVPENVHVCHCRMCQRATGGLFAALAGALKNRFRWTAVEPDLFASSSLATRAFCSACGTPLGFTYNLPEARQYVTMGSLDNPANAPVTRQYGIEAKLPFVEFCETLPQERTAEDPDHANYMARMESHQA